MSAGERTGGASGARFAWILAPLAALLAAVPLASRATGTPIGDFTRDIFSTAEVPLYTGIVSNVGIILWGTTAAICLFARGLAPEAAARRFLLASAAVSAALAVDDAFMIHEWVGPRLTGLDEKVFLGTYAVGFAAYLAAFRGAIRRAGPGALAVALGLFALSTGMDVIEPEDAAGWQYLTEEGFKLLGIGVWLGFSLGVAADAAGRDQRSAQATAASKSASPSGVSNRNVSS